MAPLPSPHQGANIRRNPENIFNARIQQYLERTHRMRLDVFDEANRKRPAPVEPTDGLDPSKRQRLGAAVPGAPPVPGAVAAPVAPRSSTPPIPPLPPGPVSYKDLFTLNPNADTANFDVAVFQDPHQVNQIVLALLRSIDGTKLNNALNVSDSHCPELIC